MDDLLAKAGSFLGSKAGGGSKNDDGEYGDEDQDRRKGHGQGQHGNIQEQQESHGSSGGGYGDLMGSAQVLMGAAKSKFGGGNENSNLDMGELAGAAANIVGAASQYAHLDKNPNYASYAQKAETYLHDYQTKHQKGTTQSQSHQSSGYGDYDQDEARPASHQSAHGNFSDRPGRYQDDGDKYSSDRPGRYQDDGDNDSSDRPASRYNNSNSRYEKDGGDY